MLIDNPFEEHSSVEVYCTDREFHRIQTLNDAIFKIIDDYNRRNKIKLEGSQGSSGTGGHIGGPVRFYDWTVTQRLLGIFPRTVILIPYPYQSADVQVLVPHFQDLGEQIRTGLMPYVRQTFYKKLDSEGLYPD